MMWLFLDLCLLPVCSWLINNCSKVRKVMCRISRNFLLSNTMTQIDVYQILIYITQFTWHYCSNFSRIFWIGIIRLLLNGIAQNFNHEILTIRNSINAICYDAFLHNFCHRQIWVFIVWNHMKINFGNIQNKISHSFSLCVYSLKIALRCFYVS